MALEIENALVASLAYEAVTETILAQQGIRAVTKQDVGIFAVELLDGVGDAEVSFTGATTDAVVTNAGMAVIRADDLNFLVLTFNAATKTAGDPTSFRVNVWRARTGQPGQ